jgi:RNA 3'-terminal phosphate cyclase (ATP)
VTLEVRRLGFYPAGGGSVRVDIRPGPGMTPLHLLERGVTRGFEARALVLGLSEKIALRELTAVADRLKLRREQLHVDALRQPGGTGNALHLIAAYEHVTEVITSLGERGLSSEVVAERACDEMERYLAHDAPVGEHLADQLLLPMLLGGGGSFATGAPSAHLTSNIAVIEAFGAARIRVTAIGDRPGVHRVDVEPLPFRR